MDLTSTVRSDSLPAVGSVLVPGAVASLPYAALLWGPPHNLKAFVDANQGASTVVGGLFIVSVGLLIESIGSYAEYYLLDSRHKDRGAMHERWRNYLQIAWQKEPIGQRYLRRILTTFKFELNLLVATPVTIPGTIALAYYGVIGNTVTLLLGLFIAGLVLYLYRASVSSSVLLDNVRGLLVAQAVATGELRLPSDSVNV